MFIHFEIAPSKMRAYTEDVRFPVTAYTVVVGDLVSFLCQQQAMPFCERRAKQNRTDRRRLCRSRTCVVETGAV